MIVTAARIRREAEQILQAGLPVLLPAVAEQEGLDLAPVRGWSRLADFLLLTEAQSPSIVVTTPGIVGQPQTRGRQTKADWDVRVFVVARGRSYEETADRVAAYVATARTVLLEEQFLGERAASCQLIAERYSELDTDKSRTIGSGSVTVRYADIFSDLTAGAGAPLPGVPATDHDIVIDSRGSA